MRISANQLRRSLCSVSLWSIHED